MIVSRQAEGCRVPGLLAAGDSRRQSPRAKLGQRCPGDVGAGAALRLHVRAACSPPTPFPQQHVSLPPRSNFLSIVPVAATIGPQRRAVQRTASLHAPPSSPRAYPNRAVPTLRSSQKSLDAALSPLHSQHLWDRAPPAQHGEQEPIADSVLSAQPHCKRGHRKWSVQGYLMVTWQQHCGKQSLGLRALQSSRERRTARNRQELKPDTFE